VRKLVFEIGSRLREAREQRGLKFADVERETRIRTRWLAALEAEHFDLLPERAYALGFLRTYARYLGLDEQRFVDELASRLSPEEGTEVLLSVWPARRRKALRPWIVPLAGMAALALIVIEVIGFGGSTKHASSPPAPAVRTSHRHPAVHRTTPPAVTRPAPQRPQLRIARLLLVATRGRCWMDARLGSQNGKELHLGTLEPGQSLRLRGRRIWIRLVAPSALEANVNGQRVQLPSVTPVNVVVTAAGLRAVP
jgi:cytoskeleton protein RodZ